MNFINRGLNLTKAIVNHALDGFEKVNTETLGKRILACATCKYRRKKDWICTHPECGCFIRIKAKWKSEKCPIGRWALEVLDGNEKSGCGCSK